MSGFLSIRWYSVSPPQTLRLQPPLGSPARLLTDQASASSGPPNRCQNMRWIALLGQLLGPSICRSRRQLVGLVGFLKRWVRVPTGCSHGSPVGSFSQAVLQFKTPSHLHRHCQISREHGSKSMQVKTTTKKIPSSAVQSMPRCWSMLRSWEPSFLVQRRKTSSRCCIHRHWKPGYSSQCPAHRPPRLRPPTQCRRYHRRWKSPNMFQQSSAVAMSAAQRNVSWP